MAARGCRTDRRCRCAICKPPTGSCPEFNTGVATFSPAGIPPRGVNIWISDAAQTLDGPLIIYWHALNSQPGEAVFGIGQTQLDEVLAQGGIVAAPVHDQAAGYFPWFLTANASGQEDDVLVADEVLACAIEKVGVDLRRIRAAWPVRWYRRLVRSVPGLRRLIE